VKGCFTQGVSMGGPTAFLTYGGMLRLEPDFQRETLEIYLDDNTKSSDFIKTLQQDYSREFRYLVDVDEEFDQEMGSYSTVISKVGIAIFVVTNLIVILILYFVVNSSITRQKRTLGIQKAIGFTTFQLMNQVSLSFLIPVAVGVFIGSVLGITQTNDVMSVGESAMVYRKGRLYHYPELDCTVRRSDYCAFICNFPSCHLSHPKNFGLCPHQ
jgi:putative ABC transport system permease protein